MTYGGSNVTSSELQNYMGTSSKEGLSLLIQLIVERIGVNYECIFCLEYTSTMGLYTSETLYK